MAANYISMFFDRMKFKISTGEIEGVKDFRIGTTRFRLSPSIDGKAAYDLFDYLSGLSMRTGPSVALSVNAAAWLTDNGVRFRTGFLWDRNLTLMGNLRSWMWGFRLKKFIARIRTDGPWLPACDAAIGEAPS